MLRSGCGLLRDVRRASCSRPRRRALDPQAIGRAMAAEPGVVEVHDLHVWEVTSGFPALVGARARPARRRLPRRPPRPRARCSHDRFAIDHTTLQVDHAARGGELLEIEHEPAP